MREKVWWLMLKTPGDKSSAALYSPLWRTVQNDLRDKVQRGRWAPGAMLPSRKSLAREYGVDLRTIQKAIADLLADGTLEAQGGRGTFVPSAPGGSGAFAPSAPGGPGAFAPSAHGGLGTQLPVGGSSEIRSIAFIFNQSFSPLEPGWQVTLQSLSAGVREHVPQSRIVAFNTYGETPGAIGKHEADALAFVEGERFDGVVMGHAGGEATIPAVRRLVDGGTPVIFLDALPFKHGCDFIGIDNRAAAREAVEYLLRIGHRRIAFLAPEEKISTIEDRLAGYQDAMRSAGLASACGDLLWRPALARSLTRDALTADLNRLADGLARDPDPPTAVFAVNDFLAHLLAQALEKHGISVPGAVSVMGFDDVDRYLPLPPFLTTTRQPFESLGLRAAEMLWHRMESRDGGPRAFQHVILPTSLIVRGSTRPG